MCTGTHRKTIKIKSQGSLISITKGQFTDQIGIWKCWFLRRGANQRTCRKTSQSKAENQQQINSTHMTPSLGIKSGPHWWEASALTTAPSMFPILPYPSYPNLRKLIWSPGCHLRTGNLAFTLKEISCCPGVVNLNLAFLEMYNSSVCAS